jgi:hypothetical protein
MYVMERAAFVTGQPIQLAVAPILHLS